jgi:Na+/H+ antiporter NhaC
MKSKELKFREVNGRRLYFPSGIGKAYVLPDPGTESRVKTWLRARQVAFFIIQFVLLWGAFQLHLNLVAVLLAIIGIDIALWFGINSLAFRGLEVVSDRSNAVELGFPYLVGVLVVCLAFVAIGIFIYPRGDWDQKAVAIGCIAFFGLGLIFALVQIIRKLRTR